MVVSQSLLRAHGVVEAVQELDEPRVHRTGRLRDEQQGLVALGDGVGVLAVFGRDVTSVGGAVKGRLPWRADLLQAEDVADELLRSRAEGDDVSFARRRGATAAPRAVAELLGGVVDRVALELREHLPHRVHDDVGHVAVVDPRVAPLRLLAVSARAVADVAPDDRRRRARFDGGEDGAQAEVVARSAVAGVERVVT